MAGGHVYSELSVGSKDVFREQRHRTPARRTIGHRKASAISKPILSSPQGQMVGGTTVVLVVLFGQAPPDTSSRALSTSTSLSEILFSAVSLRVSASPFELAPRVLLISISRLINAESHTRQWNSALGSFPEYVESHAKRFRRFPLLFRAAGNTACSAKFSRHRFDLKIWRSS